MADVESSSSIMQQPPTSTSSHMNSIPLLQAAELLADNNSQMIQQQQQIQSASGTGGNGSGAASSAVSGSGMLRSITTSANPTPASTSAGSNLVVIDPPQLGTQVGNNNGAGGDCSSLARLGTGEPPAKKQMLDHPSTSNTAVNHEKLEYRLGGILCCAVCLDLPKTAMYQCQMGHLMCAACFTHLLADGRLRDQIATCPNCRVEISKSTASRNLAVEKAASELPSECQFCNKEFPYKSLDRHELHECQERPTNCKYSRIGCQWRGPNHEATQHECNCLHPNKSGYEVMAALELYDASLMEEKKIFNTLIELLSYEKIIFNDLQMKPYRTDEYVHKLFYETARFSAFNQQWVVKARINNSQRDPHQSNERNITYQLILKTKTAAPMSIHFFALKGPFSDMKVSTQIYRHDFSDQTTESDYYNFALQEPFSDMSVVQIHLHEFTDQSTESDYYILPLPDSSECNRLLSNKGINFRLLMFLLNK